MGAFFNCFCTIREQKWINQTLFTTFCSKNCLFGLSRGPFLDHVSYLFLKAILREKYTRARIDSMWLRSVTCYLPLGDFGSLLHGKSVLSRCHNSHTTHKSAKSLTTDSSNHSSWHVLLVCCSHLPIICLSCSSHFLSYCSGVCSGLASKGSLHGAPFI